MDCMFLSPITQRELTPRIVCNVLLSKRFKILRQRINVCNDGLHRNIGAVLKRRLWAVRVDLHKGRKASPVCRPGNPPSHKWYRPASSSPVAYSVLHEAPPCSVSAGFFTNHTSSPHPACKYSLSRRYAIKPIKLAPAVQSMKLKSLRIDPSNIDHLGAFYSAASFQPSTHIAAIAYYPKPKARNDESAVRNVDRGVSIFRQPEP